MTRIIDVDKVQAALDSAARDALHGPRNVRAGRFVAGDASVGLPTGKPRLRRSRSGIESHAPEKRRGAGDRQLKLAGP
jgi:hypothetical protein